jgi:hypothetical protein
MGLLVRPWDCESRDWDGIINCLGTDRAQHCHQVSPKCQPDYIWQIINQFTPGYRMLRLTPSRPETVASQSQRAKSKKYCLLLLNSKWLQSLVANCFVYSKIKIKMTLPCLSIMYRIHVATCIFCHDYQKMSASRGNN